MVAVAGIRRLAVAALLAALVACDGGGPEAPPADAALPDYALPEGSLHPMPFGDVHAFLEAEGIAGSTEDLAFVDDRLVIGVRGGLATLDPSGDASLMELSEPLGGSVLGVAVDAAGDLWVCDPDNGALRRVAPDGTVSTALDGLDAPNYVAVGRDGHVYVSDPCAGELIRFDPAAGEVVARHPFDLPAEGGPNGFAFGPDGRLYLVTENTALLCGHGDVDLTAPIAGLYALTLTADGFGAREAVLEGIGLFGDGVAFDVAGNLYYVADTQKDFKLEESAVWVLPAGEPEPRKLLAAADRIFANLAFGAAPFGETTLYISLLTLPGFAPPEARGVERVEVGIPGRPLLP